MNTLGADLKMNRIRKGVVRGTLKLQDPPRLSESHSTQPVWVIVGLEDIYPRLVYHITQDYEPMTSTARYGDFGEGDLITASGVIHWKPSLGGLTKYLFIEVEGLRQGILWEPEKSNSRKMQ